MRLKGKWIIMDKIIDDLTVIAESAIRLLRKFPDFLSADNHKSIRKMYRPKGPYPVFHRMYSGFDLPIVTDAYSRKQRMILALCMLLLPLMFISCSGGSGGSDPGAGDPDAAGRTFYVDSVSGDDANDGLSEEEAWNSLDKVNSFDLQAGDTVRFKRGSVFGGGLELSKAGSSDNPIAFDAYGTGDNPVFLGSRTESGWSNLSGSIYQKTIDYTPGKSGAGIVLQDGTPLRFRVWNTDAATTLGADSGVFTYDPQDLFTSVIYLRCSDSADPATHTISTGYHLIGVHSQGVSNIAISNITFRNYSLHGISMRDSHNIAVTGCVAENIGGAALAVSPSIIYAGNGFEFTLDSTDCSVSDSSAVEIFDSGFSPQVFESNTTTKNVKFINCSARKCGFAGIEISVLKYGSSAGEKIENVLVSGCEVYDSGKGFSGRRYGNEAHGIRVKADAGAGSISGVLIAQTTVSGCDGSGIFIAGESGTVDVSRCSISGNSDNGITCFDNETNTTLKLILSASLVYNNTGSANGIRYAVDSGNGFEIVNNTFCNNRIALYVHSCGGSASLRNNVFYSSSSSDVYLYSGGVLSGLYSDYNCYYEHGGNIIGWGGNAYSNLAAFQAASSKDGNSIGTDPDFVSATDWHLQSASACKNSGEASGVSVDFDGNAYGASPSRGAFR